VSELFSHQWPSIALVILALTFNMYFISAQKGAVPLGNFFYHYGTFVEFANWLLVLGAVVFLSYLYTWWFLLAPFVLAPVADIVRRILGGFTQIVFLVGAPILLTVSAIFVANGR